jgi:hypothetical protein
MRARIPRGMNGQRVGIKPYAATGQAAGTIERAVPDRAAQAKAPRRIMLALAPRTAAQTAARTLARLDAQDVDRRLRVALRPLRIPAGIPRGTEATPTPAQRSSQTLKGQDAVTRADPALSLILEGLAEAVERTGQGGQTPAGAQKSAGWRHRLSTGESMAETATRTLAKVSNAPRR